MVNLDPEMWDATDMMHCQPEHWQAVTVRSGNTHTTQLGQLSFVLHAAKLQDMNFM